MTQKMMTTSKMKTTLKMKTFKINVFQTYFVLFFAELSKSATVVAVNTVEVGSHKYICFHKEVNLVTIVKMSGSYQPHQ